MARTRQAFTGLQPSESLDRDTKHRHGQARPRHLKRHVRGSDAPQETGHHGFATSRLALQR